MTNRDYNYRMHKRFVKGIKRIKADRAEHGDSRICECFCPAADKGKGKVFSRFADYPKSCACFMCNHKKWGKVTKDHRYPFYVDEDDE